MKRYLFVLLFTQIAVSQTSELYKLPAEAYKALSDKNYALAKEIYTECTRQYPDNKLYWYNLAISEINLGENTNACEHLYKAYLLNEPKLKDAILELCPNFRNGTIVSINEVDVMPKFIYEGEEFPVFEGNYSLSPAYRKILIKEMKKSRILKGKVEGIMVIQIMINRYGVFDGKVMKLNTAEKDVKIVKQEILSILRNMVKYIPAKKKGIDVDLWESHALPINFSRNQMPEIESSPEPERPRRY